MNDEITVEDRAQVNKIAYNTARRWNMLHLVDDLRQEGYIGLITAKRKYDPNLNVHLRPYLQKRITWSIINSIRATNFYAEQYPYRCDKDAKDHYDADELDFLTDADWKSQLPDEQLYMLELILAVRKAVSNLPNDVTQIIWLHYGMELSVSEIAKQIGINIVRVRKILDLTKRLLRHELRPFSYMGM